MVAGGYLWREGARIVYKNAKLGMNIVAVRQLVSRCL